jgi:hypothetical protein
MGRIDDRDRRGPEVQSDEPRAHRPMGEHRRQAFECELYAPAPGMAVGAGQDPDPTASILGDRALDLEEIGIVLDPPDR